MAKLLPIISTLICFSTLIANSKALSQESKTIPKNPNPISIYVIHVTRGPNATLYEVARSAISTNATSFGIVYVGDNAVRSGPGPNSPLLGRAQGTITTTGLTGEQSELVNYVVIFNTGKYKGSSLRIVGQRLIFGSNQEVPIGGGTGVFRGARGYALISFVSFSPVGDTYTFFYQIFLAGVGF